MFVRNRSSRRVAPRRRRAVQALLEGLESRIALSTFNVATESDLRSAIAAADDNSSAANMINITASITLNDDSAGQLVIQNGTSTAKSLVIEGQGTSATGSPILITEGVPPWNSRIFEIVGTGTASVSVIFKDLGIYGGRAHDGGVLGGMAALGGGLLIDGGQVTLSNATVESGAALGESGAIGAVGIGGKAGSNGGGGGNARGGGIYLAAGQLSLVQSQVVGGSAFGGKGGGGGTGGAGAVGGAGGNGGNGRDGGDGGVGGSGAGGGIYQAGGHLTLIDSYVTANTASGGAGGPGGGGGTGGDGGRGRQGCRWR